MLTDGLLDLVGLSEDTKNIVWDHFHLRQFVWPKALGKDLYGLISDMPTPCYVAKRKKDSHSHVQQSKKY